MVEFRWKTEGTRVAGSVTTWPPSVMLVVIVAVAFAITVLLTGKVSQQETDYKTKKAADDELTSRRTAAHHRSGEH